MSVGRKPRTCRSFQKYGYCRLAGKCTDLHQETKKKTVAAEADAGQEIVLTLRLNEATRVIEALREQTLLTSRAIHADREIHATQLKQARTDFERVCANLREKTVELNRAESKITGLQAELSDRQRRLDELENSDAVHQWRLEAERRHKTLLAEAKSMDGKTLLEGHKAVGASAVTPVALAPATAEIKRSVDAQVLWGYEAAPGVWLPMTREDSKCLSTVFEGRNAGGTLSEPAVITLNGYQVYKVDFQRMQQTRSTTGTVRNICSKYVAPPVIVDYVSTIFKAPFLAMGEASGRALMALAPTDAEYHAVAALLHAGLPKAVIVSIDRNENPAQAGAYRQMAYYMKNPSEKMLWHGFRHANLDVVLREGLLKEICMTTQSRGMAGYAIYASLTPDYSANGYASTDADGISTLLLLRCLTGDSCVLTSQSDPRYRELSYRAPLKPCRTERYDSVEYGEIASAMNRPVPVRPLRLYAFYCNTQVLISYVVRFRRNPAP
jgi:Poly(ADP-ribose) polymerase catalytic domain./WWE domain.